jgi:hypothetical protein
MLLCGRGEASVRLLGDCSGVRMEGIEDIGYRTD